MKTTVDIPEREPRDSVRFTRAKTKREAVVKVLEDFNRRRRMAELVKYAGTFSDACVNSLGINEFRRSPGGGPG